MQPYVVTLAPYGFFWFQLVEEDAGSVPDPVDPTSSGSRWCSPTAGMRSKKGRARLYDGARRAAAVSSPRVRWFVGEGPRPTCCRSGSKPMLPLAMDDPAAALAIVGRQSPRRPADRTVMPCRSPSQWDRIERLPDQAAGGGAGDAAARFAREGVFWSTRVSDQRPSPPGCWARLREQTTLASEHGRLEFRATAMFLRTDSGRHRGSRRSAWLGRQWNVATSSVIADCRRAARIPAPSVGAFAGRRESAAFSPRSTTFAQCAGAARQRRDWSPAPMTVTTVVAVVHAFIENQGERLGQHQRSYLDRLLEEAKLLARERPTGPTGPQPSRRLSQPRAPDRPANRRTPLWRCPVAATMPGIRTRAG